MRVVFARTMTDDQSAKNSARKGGCHFMSLLLHSYRWKATRWWHILFRWTQVGSEAHGCKRKRADLPEQTHAKWDRPNRERDQNPDDGIRCQFVCMLILFVQSADFVCWNESTMMIASVGERRQEGRSCWV